MNSENRKKIILPANHNVVIEGRMVILRPISENEINKKYVSWLNNPITNKFLNVRHIKNSTIETIIDYVNSLRSRSGCDLFAVFTKRKNIHVGNLSLFEYNPNNQGYVRYGLMIGDPRARMLGYGGEAEPLIVEYVFRDSAIRKIEGGVSSVNHNAIGILERLGFKREGTLRKHEVLPSGQINDFYWYGLLREEWLDNRKNLYRILRDMRIIEISETNL